MTPATYATDRARPETPWWQRKAVLVALASGLTLLLAVFGLNRFLGSQHARSLAAGDYSVGEVRRGDLAVAVQGAGALRPVEERWVTAKAGGVLTEVDVEIGARVAIGDILVRLANPELAQLAGQAEQVLAEARASHGVLAAEIADRELAQEAATANASAALREAELRLEAESGLLEKNAISAIAFEGTRIRAEQARLALDIEQRRAAQMANTVAMELRASEARLANRELAFEQAAAKQAALAVVAETGGIVQALPVSLGESVAAGTKVVRIADPSRLQAVVRVPESYAGKLAIGQAAIVRAAGEEVAATVSRVDPSVVEGTVTVDLEFAAPLPAGVRPDLSIRSTITVAELEDTLFVRRPPGIRDNQTGDVFLLNAGQDVATRTLVQFGLGTVREIQVLDGLAAGDRIVLGHGTRLEGVDAVAVE